MERQFYAPPKTQNMETPLHKKVDVPLPEEDDIVGWVDATEVGCE